MNFRNPKTTQERRNNQNEWVDDYFMPIRGSRKPRRLVDAWDDIYIHHDICWKSFRRTQYKVVNKFDVPKKDSSKFSESMKKRDHFHLNHRGCQWKNSRCKNCFKSGIWDDFDKVEDRARRKWEVEKEKREAEWRKRLEFYRTLDMIEEKHGRKARNEYLWNSHFDKL